MIIAIGAHSRKVGKTSIICALLRATSEAAWTAVKISANRRGLSKELAMEEETAVRRDCDTGRFLIAGARRAIWMRADDSQMAHAAAAVQAISAQGGQVIVESNRIVDHLQPDLYALALDFRNPDFKESARRLFHRADAYVHASSGAGNPGWPALPLGELSRKPCYVIEPPDYAPAGLIEDLRKRLAIRSEVAAA